MNPSDVQELLAVDVETFEAMLEGAGWSGQESFSDTQVAILEGMKASVESLNCDHIEAYCRTVATTEGLTVEQYDVIGEAILNAGLTLIEKRPQFPFICQRVSEGAEIGDILIPPTEEVLTDSTGEIGDIEFELPDHKSELIEMFGEEQGLRLFQLIDAATDQMDEATYPQTEQAVKDAFHKRQRVFEIIVNMGEAKLSRTLLSPKFEDWFTTIMTTAVGEEQKKQLAGVPTPSKCLSSGK